jgi:hypothetical protein
VTEVPTTAATANVPADRIVGRDGRAKAYRPLPVEARRAAIESGLTAYHRGDFFEAHEALEPAWMGSSDPAERALLQGLIKVAAAYVHDVRGNPAGIRTNLTGARRLLAEAAEGPAENAAGIDLDALLVDVDARLADLDAHPAEPTLAAPVLRRRVTR